MTLSKNAAGIYEGYFRRKGMKPLHLSMRTAKKAEAQDRYQAVRRLVREGRVEMIRQIRDGRLSVERVTTMVRDAEPLTPLAIEAKPGHRGSWDSVDAASERYVAWMTDHPNRRKATTANAGFQLRRLGNYVHDGVRIGGLALDRVPSAAIHGYQSALVAAGTPPNTITVYMARVGALWRWAAAQEERESREAQRPARALYSPVDATRLYRETHRRDRVLTTDEANALLAETPAPMLFPVACGLLAGLRIGETLHLRPGLDVDGELGTINVRSQSDWKPKTKRSIRLVPMSPELQGIARRHVNTYASASWMMPNPAKGATGPIPELAFRKQFQPIVERAGLVYGRKHTQGVTFHTLRHSFASHAVMRGVDLYTVAKLLGDSIAVVESTYADLSRDHKLAAIKLLAGAFNLTALAGTE